VAEDQSNQQNEQAGEAIEETVTGAAAQPQTAPQQQGRQVQVQIDDSQASVTYASVTQVTHTAEEFQIDFSMGFKPTGQAGVARLKVEQRVIMSPYAAKRLAMSLGQTVARYEKTYGTLELNERNRRIGGAQAQPAGETAGQAS